MNKLFEPGLYNYHKMKEAKEEKRYKISQRHPRSEFPMLKLRDNVFMGPHQKGLSKKQGVVTEVITPRRVEVTIVEGRKYIRNRMFIKNQNREDKQPTKKASEEANAERADVPSNEFSPYCTLSGRVVKQSERLTM
ncbi:hypothetical protein NPIL_309721 [Nephila pilipes]|uniref:Uncharacterized protein n=1 Tax=Nephila pilipes TaxID=299642 RepID=A0A8X6QE02_NEPPI|nr:hypothetical protein NPIL_309721 [Nephila pilipes]